MKLWWRHLKDDWHSSSAALVFLQYFCLLDTIVFLGGVTINGHLIPGPARVTLVVWGIAYLIAFFLFSRERKRRRNGN